MHGRILSSSVAIPEAAMTALMRVFDALWRLAGIHDPYRS